MENEVSERFIEGRSRSEGNEGVIADSGVRVVAFVLEVLDRVGPFAE